MHCVHSGHHSMSQWSHWQTMVGVFKHPPKFNMHGFTQLLNHINDMYIKKFFENTQGLQVEAVYHASCINWANLNFNYSLCLPLFKDSSKQSTSCIHAYLSHLYSYIYVVVNVPACIFFVIHTFTTACLCLCYLTFSITTLNENCFILPCSMKV